MSDVEMVIIAAVARNGVIGNKNELPFRLPTDMKRFKALTTGHPVVMGRLTFDSMGRPLPGRSNIVVSGDPDFRPEGCEVYDDLTVALERASQLATGQGKSAYFVLGGGQIYAQTILEADRLEITHVDKDVDGDTHFPSIDLSVWSKVADIAPEISDRDEASMRFATYRRHD